MTDKLKSILKVAREYPENLFTIEYRNKNLIHYGGESTTCKGDNLYSNIVRIYENKNFVIKNIYMQLCTAIEVKDLFKEDNYEH